jgi:hypothetical protein
MRQETGETRDAIIEEDNKLIQEIVDKNKHLTDPYWIVMFVKPARVCVEGKPTLVKHIKPYKQKPISQVGCIIGTVDNMKGTLEWEVNMPQRPFDYDALINLGAKPCNEVIVETTTIPRAYITK